jgi:hypothetical protein
MSVFQCKAKDNVCLGACYACVDGWIEHKRWEGEEVSNPQDIKHPIPNDSVRREMECLEKSRLRHRK